MKKKFLAAVLTLLLTMSLSMTALAAPVSTAENSVKPTKTEASVDLSEAADTLKSDETSETSSTYAMSRSVYGYAADYTDSTHANFYVNATGSYSLTGGATVKSSDFGASGQITYVSIYRPDGSLAVSNVKLTGNQEKVVSFTNAQVGTYTVAYNVGGVYKGWIHCWIY